MRLRYLGWWVVFCILLPVQSAASQEATPPNWLFGYNFDTGRIDVFTVENGSAQIALDHIIGPSESLEQVWRLGPQAFLVRLRVEGSDAIPTWLIAPGGWRDLSTLIDWAVFADGWAEPLFFSHSRIVLFDGLGNPTNPVVQVVDLEHEERQTFRSVDAYRPRLSADGTTLRFVGLLNDSVDQWRVIQFDLTTGGLTVLDILQITSATVPFIQSSQNGDYWLVKPPAPNLPQLVKLDGTVETITSPLNSTDLQTWLIDDHLFQVDAVCRFNCVVYARPASATAWNSYTLPSFLAMDAFYISSFIGDDLLFYTDASMEGVIRPNGLAEMIGYQTQGFGIHAGRKFILVAASPNVTTTYFVYSFERHQILFAVEAAEYPLVRFGPASIVVRRPVPMMFYNIENGQLYDLPISPNPQLEIGALEQLPDGTIVFDAHEGDPKRRYIFYDDPTTPEPPTVIIEDIELWPADSMPALR